MRNATIFLAALLLVGCWSKADQKGGDKATPKEEAGQQAEARSEPKGDAEQLVATWIRRNLENPEPKFVRWGPNLHAEEIEKLFKGAGLEREYNRALAEVFGQPFDTVVRVVFRLPAAQRIGNGGRDVGDGLAEWDLLVTVKDKVIHGQIIFIEGNVGGAGFVFNESGDQWKADVRKNLARRYPSLPSE